MSAVAGHPQPREWITPEEQVVRLTSGFIKEQLGREENRQKLGSISDGMLDLVAESIVRSSLTKDSRTSSLFDLCVQRLSFQLDPLPSILTDWYIALNRSGALPDKVPALPRNMPPIFDECPIWGHEQKPDGTHYKYCDTWSLSLKTSETINELEARVKAYGEQALNDRGGSLYSDKNPLQFRFISREVCGNLDERSNNEPYWILQTNTVLPWSRGKTCKEHDQMIAELSEKTSINFEAPSLSEIATTYFNRKIARGECIYQGGDAKDGDCSVYTRVKDTSQDYRLVVESSAPCCLSVAEDSAPPGLDVRYSFWVNDNKCISIAALWSSKNIVE